MLRSKTCLSLLASSVVCTTQLAVAAAGSGAAALDDVSLSGAAPVAARTVGEDVSTKEAAPRSEELRLRSLQVQNGLYGSTGLLRMRGADTADTGTFRFSVLGNMYSGSGFLCPDCSQPNGSVVANDDEVTFLATRMGLSVTPTDYFEGYASLLFQTAENNQSNSGTVQVMGDSVIGGKGVWPWTPDRVLTAGGSGELRFNGSPGAVGIEAASVAINALGTLDLTNRRDVLKRVPLRVHVNAGYLFDNSGALAEAIEDQREDDLGSPQRITRIERFGHNINRTDSMVLGVGAEGVFEKVRPFIEWSVDVPVNRQDHQCDTAYLSAGDSCLESGGFAAVPSRLTLGARAYPWFSEWAEGTSLLAALDIGTSGTSTFAEETRPELPWSAHIGLSYAYDVVPRVLTVEKIVEKRVVIAPPPQFRIAGSVVDVETRQPLFNAGVRYKSQPLTGMITDQQGSFRSARLVPGSYEFTVSAVGYHDGSCSLVITEPSAEASAADNTSSDPLAMNEQAPSADTGTPVEDSPLVCELKPLPKVATIQGTIQDSESGDLISGAAVAITDPLGRKLTLQSNGGGEFRFKNVQAGLSTVSIVADGYLSSVSQFELEARRDVTARLALHKKPKRPNVVVTAKELRLKKQVHFTHSSAQILPDSMAIIEEIASVLGEHPEIVRVEIQGHTDNSGTDAFNLKLSDDRAAAVRTALILNGVDKLRLTARGYGHTQPKGTNATERGRAKNRRVALAIQKR